MCTGHVRCTELSIGARSGAQSGAKTLLWCTTVLSFLWKAKFGAFCGILGTVNPKFFRGSPLDLAHQSRGSGEPQNFSPGPPILMRLRRMRVAAPPGAHPLVHTDCRRLCYPVHRNHTFHTGYASHSHINDCLFQSNIACF